MYRVRHLLAIALVCGCGHDPSAGDPDAACCATDGGAPEADGGTTTGRRMITVTLSGRPQAPATRSFLVAYQDGAAAWQLAPAPTGDVYTFEVNAPSWGVAFTCIGTEEGDAVRRVRRVTSAHFAVAERTSLSLAVPEACRDTEAVALTGTVTNRPLGSLLAVQVGSRTSLVGNATGNFSLAVPTGTHDIVVARVVPTGNNSFYVDRAAVVRDVAITGPTTQTIDFQAAEDTVQYPVTVPQAVNTRVLATTTLHTANATDALLVRRGFSLESRALAQSQRLPSDLYAQTIAVSQMGRGATVTTLTSSPGAQTFTAPAPLGMVMTTAPTKEPYILLETRWPAYADAVGYTWMATQDGTCPTLACSTVWTAYLSPGVTGPLPAYRMPELAHLTGWKEELELVGGFRVAGSVTAMTSSAGATDFPAATGASGTTRVTVRTDFGIRP